MLRLRELPPFCPAELTTGLLVHAAVALTKLARRRGHAMRAPRTNAHTGAAGPLPSSLPRIPSPLALDHASSPPSSLDSFAVLATP